jgi:hypothetical protein
MDGTARRRIDPDQARRSRALALLEHDPGKWEPVFGKGHARTRIQSVMATQLEVTTL